jgi:hypothetical protein
MKTFLIFLLTMSIALPLMHAQKNAPPTSKWTLDMDIGIPIQNDRRASYQYSSIGATYRLDKWWALTGNITYINEENSTPLRSGFLKDLIIESPHRTFRINNNNLVLNLGVQILIRVGQGDLFLGNTLGLGAVWGDLEITEPDLGREDYSLGTSWGPCVTSSLGYTYWPIKRLGVTLKVSNNNSLIQSQNSNTQQFSFWSINLGASYRF